MDDSAGETLSALGLPAGIAAVTPRTDATTAHPVVAVRRLLAQRHLAILICAAALLLKLLVPAGFMIDNSQGRIAIVLCSGTGPATTMMMDMPGMHGTMGDHGKAADHDKVEMPCAFSGLAAAVTSAVDPIQLAILIAFILAVWLGGTARPLPSRPSYLRPPPIGPPASL